MRDLDRYESSYIAGGFEDYQVRYRKKKVLSIIEDIKPRKMLEIGCGMSPLFLSYDGYDEYILYEPGAGFYENAKKQSNNDIRLKLINGPFIFDETQTWGGYRPCRLF